METGEGLRRDLYMLAACAGIAVVAIAGHNLFTPEEATRVGMVEVETNCLGIDSGVCIGYEKRSHTTYNYDDYSSVEPGDDNYYRKVEAELMLRAYEACDSSTDGYGWTSEVSYQGRSAEDWRSEDQVELLPCESTFYRKLYRSS